MSKFLLVLPRESRRYSRYIKSKGYPLPGPAHFFSPMINRDESYYVYSLPFSTGKSSLILLKVVILPSDPVEYVQPEGDLAFRMWSKDI